MDKTERLRDYGLAFLLYEQGLGLCGYELIRELFIFVKLILNSYLIKGFDISKQKNINYRIGDNKTENTNSINEKQATGLLKQLRRLQRRLAVRLICKFYH